MFIVIYLMKNIYFLCIFYCIFQCSLYNSFLKVTLERQEQIFFYTFVLLCVNMAFNVCVFTFALVSYCVYKCKLFV